MYFSAALAVFLTGVTEPLEFMFMFAAVPLYVIYAVIQLLLQWLIFYHCVCIRLEILNC